MRCHMDDDTQCRLDVTRRPRRQRRSAGPRTIGIRGNDLHGAGLQGTRPPIPGGRCRCLGLPVPCPSANVRGGRGLIASRRRRQGGPGYADQNRQGEGPDDKAAKVPRLQPSVSLPLAFLYVIQSGWINQTQTAASSPNPNPTSTHAPPVIQSPHRPVIYAVDNHESLMPTSGSGSGASDRNRRGDPPDPVQAGSRGRSTWPRSASSWVV